MRTREPGFRLRSHGCLRKPVSDASREGLRVPHLNGSRRGPSRRSAPPRSPGKREVSGHPSGNGLRGRHELRGRRAWHSPCSCRRSGGPGRVGSSPARLCMCARAQRWPQRALQSDCFAEKTGPPSDEERGPCFCARRRVGGHPMLAIPRAPSSRRPAGASAARPPRTALRIDACAGEGPA